MLSTSIAEKQESDSKLSSQLVTRELRKVLEHGKNLTEETEGQMDKRSNETGVNTKPLVGSVLHASPYELDTCHCLP